MSIKKKTTLIFIAFAFLTLTIIFFSVVGSARKSFNQLEEEQIEIKQKQISYAVDQLLRKYETILLDWSKWDDAYTYMLDHNPAFIKSNVAESVFVDQEMDFILIYDAEESLIFAEGFDLSTSQEISVDDELIKALPQIGEANGLIRVNDVDYLISSRRITNTDEDVPEEGLMVFAGFFNQRFVDLYNEEAQLDIQWEYPIKNEGAIKRTERLDTENEVILTYNIPYLNSTEHVRVTAIEPKTISRLGIATVKEILTLLSISFIILFFVLYYLVNHLINRLVRITNKVKLIESNSDVSIRVAVEGHDDLTEHAIHINHMLDELQTMNEKLKTWANIDLLTGALSRRRGIFNLEEAVAQYAVAPYDLTICFVDVNDLKKVNDRFGHQEGDNYLTEISRILINSVRKTDTVCRLGGDEFLLIFPFADQRHAEQTTVRVMDELEHVNNENHGQYNMSISVGFSTYKEGMNVDELIEMADAKMYEQKQALKAIKNKE